MIASTSEKDVTSARNENKSVLYTLYEEGSDDMDVMEQIETEAELFNLPNYIQYYNPGN